ncbi:cytochrome c oxidase accessory protein CcoG [Arenibaculum pallidiluteum]|uniref:cytochrome c oxidase accessory protein CcoG n=1 Tax=Arenibaculum pallidiluteum TaxID=2812559 RepID=UPI001A9721F3|nr:cytochrome c oxidase accessory protein CcoG [Arenibaculum pallidiluteum]
MSVPASSSPAAPALYASRTKIFPKAVDGFYRRLKWALLWLLLAVYYVAPWVRWDRGPDAPSQAILVDLEQGRLFFFMIEIWPQEVYYLTGLLILAAVALFLATSLAGRVWCGYACPQTVWTDLFLWVERKIEGDRAAQIRLDRAPMSVGKAVRKVAKHTAWLVISLLTGGAWVMYFTDAPSLPHDIIAGQVPMTLLFFVGLFTSTTYLLAGWAREQVCAYMCPWPRIQSAMLDEHSLVVTYQAWRGDERGPRRKSESWEDRSARGLGDCVDCSQCVQVCPMGIDIREGANADCINCGLCVDACAPIMDAVGRPRGLIAYDTLANSAARAEGRPTRWTPFRPRTIVYALMIVVIAAVMGGTLLLRPRLDISVQRDRAPLFVQLSDGSIRNGYTVKISNMTRQPRRYELAVEGLADARIHVAGDDAAGATVLAARPDSVATFRVTVDVPREVAASASAPLDFVLVDHERRERAVYGSVFMAPDGPRR